MQNKELLARAISEIRSAWANVYNMDFADETHNRDRAYLMNMLRQLEVYADGVACEL